MRFKLALKTGKVPPNQPVPRVKQQAACLLARTEIDCFIYVTVVVTVSPRTPQTDKLLANKQAQSQLKRVTASDRRQFEIERIPSNRQRCYLKA
jgi:hypothetical protein